MSTFSKRHGLQQADAPITIRHEAPDWLRSLVVRYAYEVEFRPSNLRSILCDLLLEAPDSSNWSEFPNIDGEVHYLLSNAEWFHVYDFIELIIAALKDPVGMPGFGGNQDKMERFCDRLNEAFRRKGVGWQLVDGKIQIRGEESFEKSIRTAVTVTAASGRAVAENEFHAALQDLSRRPNPDISGSIRHAMAALECVARDVTADPNSTFGEIIKHYPGLVPSPLDKGLEKFWGYASDQARHVREGKKLDVREAELLVGIAASVATYLIKKTTMLTS